MKDILVGAIPVGGVRTLDKNKIGVKLRLGEDWGKYLTVRVRVRCWGLGNALCQ